MMAERETDQRARQRLMTVAQAAEALALAPQTIRLWIGQRRIAHVRLGRAIRIKTGEIERVLADGEIPAQRRLNSGRPLEESHQGERKD
jgi:excisionase family DNA binding protein